MPLYDVVLGFTVRADDEVAAAKQAVDVAIQNPNTTVLVGKKISALINSNLTHVVRISDWACDLIPERLRSGASSYSGSGADDWIDGSEAKQRADDEDRSGLERR